jgi:alpha-D-ribose 1-methylphosphonate 5-triphosphate diphosphatase
VNDGVCSLPAAWRLVSENPAHASGLSDRGRLAAGLRADVVVVEWPAAGTPVVRATFAGGRLAHSTGLLPG